MKLITTEHSDALDDVCGRERRSVRGRSNEKLVIAGRVSNREEKIEIETHPNRALTAWVLLSTDR